MKLIPIHAGMFKLDGGAMFGVVPKSLWQKINPPDDKNLSSWAMRCLLIDTGSRRILIDNGMGDKQDAKFFGHYDLHGPYSLTTSLQAAGYSHADITDVLLTHLHFDHCGGSIMRQGDALVPAFPHATFWTNEEHWNWAIHPNAREKASFLKENILPMQECGRLRFVPTTHDGTVPFDDVPGVRIRFAHGHTRAMMLPQINYRGKTLVYMADLLPSAGHIPLPYVMAYDMFPMTTLDEKASFLDEALQGNYILFFEHDPEHECASLQRTEKGIRAGRVGSLEALLQAD